MQLTCQICGIGFTRPSHKGMAPLYCSTSCRSRGYRKRNPAKVQRVPAHDLRPGEYGLLREVDKVKAVRIYECPCGWRGKSSFGRARDHALFCDDAWPEGVDAPRPEVEVRSRSLPTYVHRPCAGGCGRLEPSSHKKGRHCNECRRHRITAGLYDLTIAQVRTLRTRSCGICKAKPGSKTYAIDHCHETGTVRGVLCEKCNRGIGLLGDNVERLEQAIAYLKGEVQWEE